MDLLLFVSACRDEYSKYEKRLHLAHIIKSSLDGFFGILVFIFNLCFACRKFDGLMSPSQAHN